MRPTFRKMSLRWLDGLQIPGGGESISASTRVRGYRLGDEHALVEMSRSIFPEHYEQRSLAD
jgi:hypothetical protein